ncbi:MAG: MFS transporter [Rhizobiaceae bacterium]|nr:MFS transporter [Rhizobiaceae bacterium]MCV0404959.1 MFS transporter [Rhizobiaceae bacterium]
MAGSSRDIMDQPAAAEAGRYSYGRPILFLALASFAAAATTRIMDAILPQLVLEFDVSIGSVSFVATGYALAYGGFQLVFGPLGDRYGKYRVILFACVGSALATLACAFAATLTGIAAARVLSGVMAAAIVPLAIAWIGDVVPNAHRQAMLARFMSSQIMGLLTGQISGGVLGEYFGWRSAFVFIGSIYLFAVVGMTVELIRNPLTSARAGGAGGGIWRTLDVFGRLLRRPVVRFVLAMVTIEAFAMFGAFTYVGASLNLRYGFNFATIGLYLGLYCVGGLFYVTQSRRLIAWLGPARLSFWGTVLVAVAYVALAFAPGHLAYPPAIVVMGVGFYMLHNTLQTMATQMAPDARGSAVAIFATCYFLSQSVGVYIAGQVIDGHGPGPVFLTAGALLLCLGFILLARMPEELARSG